MCPHKNPHREQTENGLMNDHEFRLHLSETLAREQREDAEAQSKPPASEKPKRLTKARRAYAPAAAPSAPAPLHPSRASPATPPGPLLKASESSPAVSP